MRLITLVFIIGVSFVPALFADGIIAVLKDQNTVYRSDAQTGAFKGSIQVNKAGSLGCDGQTIAVLQKGGFINRYSADSGNFLGQIQVGPNASNLQVASGVIVVTTGNSITRYNARTGAFLGTN